jgi:hypothetical protein
MWGARPPLTKETRQMAHQVPGSRYIPCPLWSSPREVRGGMCSRRSDRPAMIDGPGGNPFRRTVSRSCVESFSGTLTSESLLLSNGRGVGGGVPGKVQCLRPSPLPRARDQKAALTNSLRKKEIRSTGMKSVDIQKNAGSLSSAAWTGRASIVLLSLHDALSPLSECLEHRRRSALRVSLLSRSRALSLISYGR